MQVKVNRLGRDTGKENSIVAGFLQVNGKGATKTDITKCTSYRRLSYYRGSPRHRGSGRGQYTSQKAEDVIRTQWVSSRLHTLIKNLSS
ncbi:hypothetical protein ES703_81064 [subsurface metagenome]